MPTATSMLGSSGTASPTAKAPTLFLSRNQFKGDKYVGEFRDGKYLTAKAPTPHANGNKYVGEYRDNKKHGQGTYYSLADNQFKGDKYVGEYRDDKKHGQGTYTFANGDKYVGEHRDKASRPRHPHLRRR
jgi:hypothetical protein